MFVHRAIAGVLALALAAAIAIAPVAAQDATPVPVDSPLAQFGFPEITITTDGVNVSAPADLQPGRYRVVFENTSESWASLEVLQVPAGMTAADIQAVFDEFAQTGAIPEIFFEPNLFNGGASAEAGMTEDVVLDIAPGEGIFNVYYVDETTQTEVNQPFPFTVSEEMPVDIVEPDAAVEVIMVDFDFQMPDTIPAGQNVWKVENVGDQPHHIIVSSVPEGTTEEQVMDLIKMFFGPMDEATPPADGEAPMDATPAPVEEATPPAAPLDPAQVIDVFETPILSPGVVNWISPDLGPGTYVAICFIPTPEGVPHVMLGMVEVFTVGDEAATPAAN
jgi:hypothetical protein